ncbi:RICIN domain-containing protein [Streptomyces africanus]|uniref:RICIN domain-containing protein n=1 Tax=Streptomyces africanus TaxID=231024 RepID=UPI000A3BE989|nr:hypothetical protein [Streptomyces africanus]
MSVGNTGSYYLQWRHPVYGDGCLTALGSGHVVEGRSNRNSYRIHVVQNGMCLGVNGTDDRAAGAEIAQQRCTGSRDQEFLVDAVD